MGAEDADMIVYSIDIHRFKLINGIGRISGSKVSDFFLGQQACKLTADIDTERYILHLFAHLCVRNNAGDSFGNGFFLFGSAVGLDFKYQLHFFVLFRLLQVILQQGYLFAV